MPNGTEKRSKYSSAGPSWGFSHCAREDATWRAAQEIRRGTGESTPSRWQWTQLRLWSILPIRCFGEPFRTAGNLCGEITDWKELGASPAPIVVIGREAGSGTRLAFEQAIGLTTSARHAQEQNETGLLRTAVSLCPGAIGYLSFDYAARAQESEAFPSRERFPARELCAPDAIR